MSDTLTVRQDVGVTLVDHMGGDQSILAAMLVSTQAGASLEMLRSEPDACRGRLGFLMRNRHGTPFEHGAMTFFIEAPIFVFREFHRHRIGWSYNEESARYKQLAPVFYLPGPDRPLVQVGKPGAYTFEPGTIEQMQETNLHLIDSYKHSYRAYEHLISRGVAKEIARACLPVAIFSSMYATCNPRSLMAFLSLRTRREGSMFPSGPMREIEMVAEKMEGHFAELFPVTYSLFHEHGRVAP